MLLFTFDLGNKQVKMQNGVEIKVFPSYFLDSDDLGDRNLLSGFNFNNHTNDYISSKDHEKVYVWGNELDFENVQVIDTIAFKERYNSKFYKLLVDFTLAELASSYDCANTQIVDVVVCTGVPSDDYMRDDVLENLSRIIKGDHSVTIGNLRYYVRVHEVHFLPQPIGTLFNEIIDEHGDLLDSPLMNSSVGIVDVGGGTLLIDFVNKISLEKNKRSQSKNGAFTLYDMIVSELIKCGYDSNVYEIERFIRKNNGKNEYLWSYDGISTVEVTDIVMNCRTRFTNNIIRNIKNAYKAFDRVQYILVTGGASNLLIKELFMKEFPNARFIDNAEVANVNGYYKYGISQGLTQYGDN